MCLNDEAWEASSTGRCFGRPPDCRARPSEFGAVDAAMKTVAAKAKHQGIFSPLVTAIQPLNRFDAQR